MEEEVLAPLLVTDVERVAVGVYPEIGHITVRRTPVSCYLRRSRSMNHKLGLEQEDLDADWNAGAGFNGAQFLRQLS